MNSSFRLRYNAYMKAKKKSELIAKILSFLVLAICVCPVVWYFLDRECSAFIQHVWWVVKLIVLTIISSWIAGFSHLIIERFFLHYLYAKEIKRIKG